MSRTSGAIGFLFHSILAACFLAAADTCHATCRSTSGNDPEIQFGPDVMKVLGQHRLSTTDIFRSMNITSNF